MYFHSTYSHPWLLFKHPAFQPSVYRWSKFDPLGAELIWRVIILWTNIHEWLYDPGWNGLTDSTCFVNPINCFSFFFSSSVCPHLAPWRFCVLLEFFRPAKICKLFFFILFRFYYYTLILYKRLTGISFNWNSFPPYLFKSILWHVAQSFRQSENRLPVPRVKSL